MAYSLLNLTDAYKLGHISQYPKGTNLVFSNFTPRKARSQFDGTVPPYFVWFGLSSAWLNVQMRVNETFFGQEEDEAVEACQLTFEQVLGRNLPEDFESSLRALHKLNRLPVNIYALPEGSIVNHGTPVMVIYNTDPQFYWLVNFLETILSAELWHVSTSATTASLYYKNFKEFANKTSDSEFLVPFQGHDFSFRGQTSLESASKSGMGHLVFFQGTDTLCSLTEVEYAYGWDYETDGILGVSVPATEHSVMSAGGYEDELETFRRLITEVYPEGIVSIVSDTWDFWKVVTEYLPTLRDTIISRSGKVVIRPDSSPKTPVEIIIGDPEAPEGSPENLGLIRCLDQTFGSTVNSKGYKELHPSIGAIYGDSITLDYQRRILEGLEKMGYASTNIVLGIGSFAYQYVTRDTHGIAIKATACEINGHLKEIFKDPKTDNGTKKSLKGLVAVTGNAQEGFVTKDQVTWHDVKNCAFEFTVDEGEFNDTYDFADVRATAMANLERVMS